jgi:aryl carrier-like protein
MSEEDALSGPTIEDLRAAVAELVHLEPAQIADDTDLILLGLESLGVMRLVNRWRREGIRVSSRSLVAEPTLKAWQAHLEESRRTAAAEGRVSALRPGPDRAPGGGGRAAH